MASTCLIYLSLLFSLLFCYIEGISISLVEEEELELEKELQSLNKTPIKTLKSSFTGDLFDCIEIYKQPAFEHPALKNHKLQMRPSFHTNNVTREGKMKSLLDQGFNDTCPPGTVIIRRTRKEDLIIAKELPKYFRNYGSSYHTLDHARKFFAIKQGRDGKLHGFKSKITAWALRDMGQDQSSANQVWMLGNVYNPIPNKLNVIQTGWHIVPKLYNNTFSRFFTYWTIDDYKTGCMNLECKGFVQTSAVYAPGFALTALSTYGGKQEYFDFQILKDPQYGMWWLSMEGIDLGYWPKEIFTNFDKATAIDFGGTVYSPKTEASPPMGNGHFPEEGIGKASYFMDVQFIGEDQQPFIPGKDWAVSAETAHDYYRVLGDNPSTADPWNVAYGGPGGYLVE